MIVSVLKNLLPCACALLALSAHAEPDLSAPEAAAQAQAGKLTLIDIRTPPEWKETGVARGARQVNMLHPQGASGGAGPGWIKRGLPVETCTQQC